MEDPRPGAYMDTMELNLRGTPMDDGAVDAGINATRNNLELMDTMVADLMTTRKIVRFAEAQGHTIDSAGFIMGCKVVILSDIAPDRFILFSRTHPEIPIMENVYNVPEDRLASENPDTVVRLRYLETVVENTVRNMVESGEWDLRKRKMAQGKTKTQEWLARWTRK